jgi:hypothetical protein
LTPEVSTYRAVQICAATSVLLGDLDRHAAGDGVTGVEIRKPCERNPQTVRSGKVA